MQVTWQLCLQTARLSKAMQHAQTPARCLLLGPAPVPLWRELTQEYSPRDRQHMLRRKLSIPHPVRLQDAACSKHLATRLKS